MRVNHTTTKQIVSSPFYDHQYGLSVVDLRPVHCADSGVPSPFRCSWSALDWQPRRVQQGGSAGREWKNLIPIFCQFPPATARLRFCTRCLSINIFRLGNSFMPFYLPTKSSTIFYLFLWQKQKHFHLGTGPESMCPVRFSPVGNWGPQTAGSKCGEGLCTGVRMINVFSNALSHKSDIW